MSEAPYQRQRRRVPRDQAEQRKDVGRVLCREILDPAEEGRMAHVETDEDDGVERKEHRDLDQHGPATRERIDLLALVKLHHRLLLGSAIILESFLHRLHFGLHPPHRRHRGVGATGEREKQRLDDHCHAQHRKPEIAEEAVKELQQEKHRLGDEEEPAPVDQQVEAVELLFGLVRREHGLFLGAGEHIADVLRSSALGDGDRRRADEARLVLVEVVGLEIGELRVYQLARGRNDCGCPVLVGEAEPARGIFELDLLVALQVRVLLGHLVVRAEDADRPFVLDEEVRNLRRSLAHDARIREQ